MKFLNLTLAAGLSALLLISATAQSAPSISGNLALPPILLDWDAKVFPGVGCHASFDGTILVRNSELGIGISGDNQDFSSLVECPLVRDNVTNTNGVSVRVQATRWYLALYGGPPPAQRMSCTLSSMGPDGTLITSNTQSVLVNGPVSLSLRVSASVENGHYSLNCTLPKTVYLTSYRLTEFQQTDFRS